MRNKGEKRRTHSGKDLFNRSILRITYGVALIFLGLMAYFIWFVQVESPNVIGNTYNPRVDLMAERVIRGKIKTADGVVLAETLRAEDGTETRSYPYGTLYAPVTGYSQKGKTGIESLANFYLLSSHVNILEQTTKELLGEKNTGDNVWLTIRHGIQAAASEALGDRKGAVIAMDPETGEILCMVSKPSFDPNTIQEDWEALTAEDNREGQLLNRAAQGSYPPGSTFKMVTVLEYIHEHPSDYQDFRFSCSGSYTDPEGNRIQCYGGEAHGEQDLFQAFANSCNGAFARIGEEISPQETAKLAEKLLFNQALPFDLPYTRSSYSLQESDSLFLKEQTAIGQGKTTMSPLHNLLLTAAVANGGELMKPRLLSHLENAGGENFRSFSSERAGRLLSQEDAGLLKELMGLVVTEGTGSAFRGAPYGAYAKTGSAEYESGGERKTHAWCNAIGEGNGKQLAVCVIVEDGKSGGSTAAPVARAVLDAWWAGEEEHGEDTNL